jgi:hypothetical protein
MSYGKGQSPEERLPTQTRSESVTFEPSLAVIIAQLPSLGSVSPKMGSELWTARVPSPRLISESRYSEVQFTSCQLKQHTSPEIVVIGRDFDQF